MVNDRRKSACICDMGAGMSAACSENAFNAKAQRCKGASIFIQYGCVPSWTTEVKIACAVGRMSPLSKAVYPEASAATSAAYYEMSLFSWLAVPASILPAVKVPSTQRRKDTKAQSIFFAKRVHSALVIGAVKAWRLTRKAK